MSQMTALRLSVRTAAIMIAFTLAFTGLMSSVYTATKDTIAASAEKEKMKLVDEVLPRGDYDNELLKDFIGIGMPPELGLKDPGRVYRARKAGQPAAVLVEAIAPDGYSGDVGLILSIRADGRVGAVRITGHKETPGLGDYIDIHKDKKKNQPWITQFEKLGFADVAQAEWKVRKDGGKFVYRTGATISARAVTNAIGRALNFYGAHKDQLFALPAGGKM